MRLEASCAIAVILNFTNRLVARFHRNGSRIYALSLLLQRGIDQRDQSNQANQSCDYEGEDRRPYRYVNSQKQGGKSSHGGFKDTTNDGESSCFAKVAVPVGYEVCHRDANSKKCAADVHCETSGCCCRGEPPEKKLGDQNDGCKDGDQRVIFARHFHHSFHLKSITADGANAIATHHVSVTRRATLVPTRYGRRRIRR